MTLMPPAHKVLMPKLQESLDRGARVASYWFPIDHLDDDRPKGNSQSLAARPASPPPTRRRCPPAAACPPIPPLPPPLPAARTLPARCRRIYPPNAWRLWSRQPTPLCVWHAGALPTAVHTDPTGSIKAFIYTRSVGAGGRDAARTADELGRHVTALK